ncbi:hypothetical protein FRB90_010990 [Tulasnella sp. 427]|nr:hypothetical protein FRB90_010990 [Tulasnella sp. 427]
MSSTTSVSQSTPSAPAKATSAASNAKFSVSSLAPQDMKVLGNILLIEWTGGSIAWLKSIESSKRSPTSQFKKGADAIVSEVNITVEANTPTPGQFKITFSTPGLFHLLNVYHGVGYGSVAGHQTVTSAFGKGLLTLNSHPGWNGLVNARDVTFRSVPTQDPLGNAIAWDIYVDGKPVMNIQATLNDSGIIGAGGPIVWMEQFPGIPPVHHPHHNHA